MTQFKPFRIGDGVYAGLNFDDALEAAVEETGMDRDEFLEYPESNYELPLSEAFYGCEDDAIARQNSVTIGDLVASMRKRGEIARWEF